MVILLAQGKIREFVGFFFRIKQWVRTLATGNWAHLQVCWLWYDASDTFVVFLKFNFYNFKCFFKLIRLQEEQISVCTHPAAPWHPEWKMTSQCPVRVMFCCFFFLTGRDRIRLHVSPLPPFLQNSRPPAPPQNALNRYRSMPTIT